MFQNVPVHTAKDWADEVKLFCEGKLKMTSHSFIKQDNTLQRIYYEDDNNHIKQESHVKPRPKIKLEDFKLSDFKPNVKKTSLLPKRKRLSRRVKMEPVELKEEIENIISRTGNNLEDHSDISYLKLAIYNKLNSIAMQYNAVKKVWPIQFVEVEKVKPESNCQENPGEQIATHEIDLGNGGTTAIITQTEEGKFTLLLLTLNNWFNPDEIPKSDNQIYKQRQNSVQDSNSRVPDGAKSKEDNVYQYHILQDLKPKGLDTCGTTSIKMTHRTVVIEVSKHLEGAKCEHAYRYMHTDQNIISNEPTPMSFVSFEDQKKTIIEQIQKLDLSKDTKIEFESPEGSPKNHDDPSNSIVKQIQKLDLSKHTKTEFESPEGPKNNAVPSNS